MDGRGIIAFRPRPRVPPLQIADDGVPLAHVLEGSPVNVEGQNPRHLTLDGVYIDVAMHPPLDRAVVLLLLNADPRHRPAALDGECHVAVDHRRAYPALRGRGR